jgi:hypothetical protein
MDKYRSEWQNLLEGTVYSGNGYAEFNTTGAKVLSNVAWLISPKIDMDTTNEILTFRTAQHHLDVDSPLNSLEVFVSSNFDGLVTKATWIPLKVILPKQATVSVWFLAVWTYLLGKINIAFRYTGSGKNLALDGAFQVDDAGLGSKMGC